MSVEVPVPEAQEATPGLLADIDQAGHEELLSVAEQLQDLILESGDVAEFLVELSEYSAMLASPEDGEQLDCAVTLSRRRRLLTGGGNTERAQTLNRIQERFDQGPCLTALREVRTVLVRDTHLERRWPDYTKVLLAENIRSVMAVPLTLSEGSSASINFFSGTVDAFNDRIVAAAELYAKQAQRALELAVKMGHKQQLVDDLEAAMKSRTAIDIAVGIIMAEQRCTQTAAFDLLAKAASTRNQKLRDLAAEIVEKVSEEPVATHFDR